MTINNIFPCCEGNKVVYTDEDGEWGVENNIWCDIKDSCTTMLKLKIQYKMTPILNLHS